MKKTFDSAFRLLLVALSLWGGRAFGQTKYAVVVGCANYQDDRNDLNYCDDDAYRFYAYLKSCEGGAVPDDQIACLVDEAATKDNILGTAKRMFSQAGPQDMVIFYFSGHGTTGAFCPTDISSNASSLLYHSELQAVFRESAARDKLVFADACYSGSIYEGRPSGSPGATESYQQSNILIFMSSLESETSAENPRIRQGTFSYYLLKGLKGSADRNGDKQITVEELFPYVKANVLNFSGNDQTPFIEGNASRQMVVGRCD